jgi:LysR family transcriptional regulator, glycine cleavage system transcriptional activator
MPVRPPSLRSIAAFEAAARHQSFTRAASELNLTTGAISHAIKVLEQRLGRQLFERSGRQVILTADGLSLASRVRLSLALLSDAFDVAPWLSRDRLIVSALPFVAERILLPSLAALKEALPGIAIDLVCSSTLADLATEADVAVRFGPGGWNGVQSRLLANERLFPVASPTYRGGALPRVPEELRDCEIIHHPESAWRLWLDPVGLSAGDLRSSLWIDDSSLVLEAAADGHGIALARGRLAKRDLESGRLVRLFEQDVSAEYSYWAVWSGTSPKRRLIEAFVTWAEASFGD